MYPFLFSFNKHKAGEVITLPVVVLISLMLQPRLQYALAKDGLLPMLFCKVKRNIPFQGTIIAGVLMTIIATFVPFSYLDDFVSAGILLAFSVSNSALVLLRHRSPDNQPYFLEKHMVLFNVLAFSTSLLIVHCYNSNYIDLSHLALTLSLLLLVLMSMVVVRIFWYCPPMIYKTVDDNGEERATVSDSICPEAASDEYATSRNFTLPFIPFLPCLGIFINWYLIAQLEVLGILFLAGYTSLVTIFYFKYGIKNSIGNNGGWVNHN